MSLPSGLADPLPTLDDLISYLLSSKRSLASAKHIYRANSLVTETSRVLTSIAALSARNAFLSRSLQNQLVTLRAIHHGLDLIAENSEQDFRNVLHDLDDADIRIKDTLEVLKNTVVNLDDSQPAPPARAQDPQASSDLLLLHDPPPAEQKQLKTLFNFIDEAGVDSILAAFRTAIDEVNSAQDALTLSTSTFEQEISSIAGALSSADNAATVNSSSGSSDFAPDLAGKGKQGKEQNVGEKLDLADVAGTFRTLEEHATEMAGLLQSLVTHYDLCVKALRHTEGGGEVVAGEQARSPVEQIGDVLPDAGKGDEQHELHDEVVGISEEEREEMLKVLRNDADEVEDVVAEISERAHEMEMLHSSIRRRLEACQQHETTLKMAMVQMADVGKKLPLYIEAGAIFEGRWSEQKNVIAGKMEELEGLRSFYEGFIKAYDGLLGVIKRRQLVKEKVDRILADAKKKVDRLYLGMLDVLSVYVNVLLFRFCPMSWLKQRLRALS